MVEEIEEIGNGKYPKLRMLVDDAILMANFALQKGSLPDDSTLAEIYNYQRKLLSKESLDKVDIEKILEYYESLRRVLVNVTPETLRNTEGAIEGRKNLVRRHLKKLYQITILMIVVIFFINSADYLLSYFFGDPGDEASTAVKLASELLDRAAEYAIPFTYGVLGACAYLLRVTEKHLRQRDFDVSRIAEHNNRLMLGALSGGVIVLFIQDIPNGQDVTFQIAEGALGFLAGYSIDLLFDTLDRIIQAILPKVGLETIQKRLNDKQKEIRLRRMEEMKGKSGNPEVKKVLKDMIDLELME